MALANWKKSNSNRKRTAIVTHGGEPVYVSVGGEPVQEFPIPALTKDQIVDTNGAGDAFVGGFLSQLYLDAPLAQCVSAGIYLSGQVVQRSGCTFPDNMTWSA